MRPFMIILATILFPFSLLGQSNLRMPEKNLQLKSVKESKVRLDSTVTIRESTGSKEKMHFLYDSEGHNTECINYDFDKSTSKWVQSGTETCTYDSAWNLTSVITDGQYKHKEEFNYDKTGNLQTVIYYQQDNSSNWYEIFRDEYEHDIFQNKIYAVIHIGEHCIFYFDNEGKIKNVRWAETDSLEFRYDLNGNIKSKTHFFNDPPLCPFVISEKDEYFYDDINNSVSSKSSSSTLSGWCPDGTLFLSRESKYLYDKGVKLKDLILPYVFNFDPFSHYGGWSNTWNFLLDFKITERINYHNNQRIKYYYSDQAITGINENTQGKSVVYPNPATDFINLSVGNTLEPAKIEVYNNLGKMVMIDDLLPGKQISVKHLQRGFYIYKLSSQNTVETGKIILQ